MCKCALVVLLFPLLSLGAGGNAAPVSSDQAAPAGKDKKFNAGDMIMHHITDSHEWHFLTIKKKDGSEWHATIYLPVILYTPGEGWSAFSYHKLHKAGSYKGYALDSHHKIIRTDGKHFYDFSLTKNVAQLLLSMVLMIALFVSVARRYQRQGIAAPRGLQAAVEVIIVFIRDQVARPLLGHRADRYLPYLLTLFFFIWINNLLGLLPGAANVTGNISVTATLALLTFILMMTGSKRDFWLHMFSPPGVPAAVLPILVPIEFLSNVVLKPFALLIRLFANMLAGHLIILSFMSIIFLFAAMSLAAGIGASIFSVAFSVFVYLLELLVAVLQAYIFTILSALFISETGATHSHDHEHVPATVETKH
ncbi:MAG: F0F1 ATP synthase subunit A [Chitinophagales bacterium]|nr:F0F1 ATP synthase subunit A [Chitinophagales bacterium]MDW8428860.1 F0F1 ATP synthase subunit A [Chitinophagales bacterium]